MEGEAFMEEFIELKEGMAKMKEIYLNLLSDKDHLLIVTADFTTHGGSHFYGLPYPSADSLDPMDQLCTFDVSNIIPKNMQKLL